jgi:hypothetical protein
MFLIVTVVSLVLCVGVGVGVVVVDKQSLVVVTHSGSFNVLHVVRMGLEITLQSQVLNSIKVPKSAYYGITASHNKAIFCLVTRYTLLCL